MNKQEFRSKYKNIRNNIEADIAKNKSDLICDNLIQSGLLNDCNCVFVYLSYGREVNTQKLIDYLYDDKKFLLIPKCDIKTETMIPVVYNKEEKLEKNIYGIKESICTDEYKDKIDIVIVPGICFDRFGNRVGHGKGYYDKFFENNNILKIGLCYNDCLSDDKIPCSPNDIKMDYVITDREVLEFKS